MRTLQILSLMLAGFLLGQATFALKKTTVIPEVNMRVKTAVKNAVKNKVDSAVETTHIDREAIKTSPATTVSGLLQREQSIVRLTNNAIDSNQTALSIRGFGENAAANSLILIDGFPLTNASLLAPNFNAFALSDIERMDIVQGSQGSLWGDQEVGGVVNIITRHPKKWMAEGEIGVGSFQQRFYSVLLANKFNNGFFFKIAGFSNQADQFRQHNHQNNKSVLAAGGIDYARGTLSVMVQSAENSSLFPGALTRAQFMHHPRLATNFTNFTRNKMQRFQVFNQQAFTSQWMLETRFIHQRNIGDGLFSSAMHREEGLNILNPRLIGTVNKHKIILGYFWENEQYHFANALFRERVHAQQNHVYGQFTIPLSTLLDLTIGGREAWQSSQAERILGHPMNAANRLGVSEQGLFLHPGQSWTFFVRRDGNFRFPKTTEMTFTPSPDTPLRSQTGVSYEAGSTYRKAQYQTQLSIYRLQLHNEIAFDPTQTPTQPFGSFSNFAQTVRDGMTMTETWQFAPPIILNAQINYVNARFASGIFSGNRIPTVPSLNANANIQYSFAKNWRIKYAALYTGSSFAGNDEANAGPKQPGYWLHALALQYSYRWLEASLELSNMFDQRYAVYTFYDADSHSCSYYPGAGRSLLLTINASLDK